MKGKGKINDRFTVLRSSRLKSIPNSCCVHLQASDPTGTEAEPHGKGASMGCCHPRMEQVREDFGVNKMKTAYLILRGSTKCVPLPGQGRWI